MTALLQILLVAVLQLTESAIAEPLDESSGVVPRAGLSTTGFATVKANGMDSAKVLFDGIFNVSTKKLIGKSEVAVHIDFPPGFDDKSVTRDTRIAIYRVNDNGSTTVIVDGTLGTYFPQIKIASHKAHITVENRALVVIGYRQVAWNKKGIAMTVRSFVDTSKLYLGSRDSTVPYAEFDGGLYGENFFYAFGFLKALYVSKTTGDGTLSRQPYILKLNSYTATVNVVENYIIRSPDIDENKPALGQATTFELKGSSSKPKP